MKRRGEIVLMMCVVGLLAIGWGIARAGEGTHTAKKTKTGAADETLQFDATVQMPKPLKQVPPKYPESARKRGATGTVLVRALVTKDGTVGRVVVPRGKGVDPDLERAAVDAVRQWTFEPAKKNGTPVDVYVMIPVKFRLDAKGK
jgi:TonB family protein